jgi:hypothetical protein
MALYIIGFSNGTGHWYKFSGGDSFWFKGLPEGTPSFNLAGSSGEEVSHTTPPSPLNPTQLQDENGVLLEVSTVPVDG